LYSLCFCNKKINYTLLFSAILKPARHETTMEVNLNAAYNYYLFTRSNISLIHRKLFYPPDQNCLG
jgi:hypothetical protein